MMPEDPQAIEVQIDALAFNGFAAFDADAFGAALSGELARLIAVSPVRGGWGATWRVDSVRVDAGSGVDSAFAGTQVARAIYAQMSGGGS